MKNCTRIAILVVVGCALNAALVAAASSNTATPVTETGYLIDVETLAKDKKGHYLLHPEEYTVGQAKAAWVKHVDFTLLLPPAAATSVVNQHEANLFGWSGLHNPQQLREGKHLNKVAYRPADEAIQGRPHKRSFHTIVNEEVDREAIGNFINHRPSVHDNQGHLKVTTTRHLPLEQQQGNRQSTSSNGRVAALQANLTGAAFNVEGYLVDIYCMDRGPIALDGANLLTNPEAHSVHCNLLSICIAGGYLILTAPVSGATAYGVVYNLTSAGNDAAVAWMKTLPDNQKNVLVSVSGRYDSSGKLEIVSSASNTFGGGSSSGGDATVTTSGSAQALAAAYHGLVFVGLVLLTTLWLAA